MTAPAEPLAQYALTWVENHVNQFINTTASNVISVIGPAAASLLAIYVLLWGMGIAIGRVQEPLTDGMIRICRMSIIVTLALSASFYQTNVVQFFTSAPNEIAGAIIGSGSDPSNTNTFALTLDKTLDTGFQIGARAWAQGGLSSPGYYLLALDIDIVVVIVVAIAIALIATAYVVMAIVLSVGPLFILLAIFQQTQRFFEQWLGTIIGFCFKFILIAACQSLVFAMLTDYLNQVNSADDFLHLLIGAMETTGICIIAIIALLQTNSIAAHLGHGIALRGQNLASRTMNAGKNVAQAAGMAASGVGAVAGGVAALYNSAGGNRVRPNGTGSMPATANRIRQSYANRMPQENMVERVDRPAPASPAPANAA